MSSFTAVAERDPDTGLHVGVARGIAGVHIQGASLRELRQNLAEVLSMVLEGRQDAVAAAGIVVEVAPRS